MRKSTEMVETAVSIAQIDMAELEFCIVGTSPLVIHAVSAKAKGSLLFPAPKKTAAEKATSMKHEPFEEFQDACYCFRDEDETPTRLYMPAGAFHGAMGSAAIDMIGAKKAQVGRLTSVIGGTVPIFGIPQLWMTMVRSSDMARTPDVRTLPILPQWACSITVRFVGSLIKQMSIVNLLSAAGQIIGVGDGRPEKGKLDRGRFRICSKDDPEFVAVTSSGGRASQDAALDAPAYFDRETEALMNWFEAERGRRTAAPAQMPKAPRTTRTAATGNGGRTTA